MARPRLVHFMAVATNQFISVKASITLGNKVSLKGVSIPIYGLPLLWGHSVEMKILGYGDGNQCLYCESFESDGWGTFNFKIPLRGKRKKISILSIYEVGHNPGIEWFLGAYMPLKISSSKQVIVSDFDKTLADTRYSTTGEVYASLTGPLSDFPPLQNSVKIFKDYITKGFHPFILSSSPHFYESAIRDWLYAQGIYRAGIFLKDYRRVFSLVETILTLKDIRTQGLYKLNQLLDILLMTGIPHKLVLLGDNFEEDPAIYAVIILLLYQKKNPGICGKC